MDFVPDIKPLFRKRDRSPLKKVCMEGAKAIICARTMARNRANEMSVHLSLGEAGAKASQLSPHKKAARYFLKALHRIEAYINMELEQLPDRFKELQREDSGTTGNSEDEGESN